MFASSSRDPDERGGGPAQLVLACETIISEAAGGGFCERVEALNSCGFALLAVAILFWGSRGRFVSRIPSVRGRLHQRSRAKVGAATLHGLPCAHSIG
jgi:hypothetical protein